MNKEQELLKPRYKVIADWPGVSGRVIPGDILKPDNIGMYYCAGKPFLEDKLKDYPHLFRKLEDIETSEEELLEEKTTNNMNLISSFLEHLKAEAGLDIPEQYVLSFFNA